MNLILVLTTDSDWHYGQPNGHSEDGQILEEFLVLLIHRNDDGNLVVLLGDFYESNRNCLKAEYVGC